VIAGFARLYRLARGFPGRETCRTLLNSDPKHAKDENSSGEGGFPLAGAGHAMAPVWYRKVKILNLANLLTLAAMLACLFLPCVASAQAEAPKKVTWKSVEFAIVRFNDEAPNSWNIYHSEKKGILLVRLWKRYMLVKIQDEEVYDIDPQKITVHGDSAEWSYADIPDKPIEVVEWKERNIGSMQRITFRFGKNGHVLELQIPLGLNREPMY
jgi:hypothetical protein